MFIKLKGFSLIELMIVIAIIGILAAIAIPQYQNHVARSQVSEALSLASGLKTAVADVSNQDGALTGIDSGTNDIPLANTIYGKYVSSVAVDEGVITVTMNATGVNGTSALISTRTLVLTPSLNGGSVSWNCSGTINSRFRPKAC